jgi:hypothetical protein
MFIADDLLLPVSFPTACDRLAAWVARGGLRDSSESAFAGGMAELTLRVGPLGDLPGVSKLVAVRFLRPATQMGALTQGLRWEATGRAGGLFPVLDADIRLAAEGTRRTRLSLAGSYRPPLGRVGAALDRVVLGQVANATIGALLHDLAGALDGPDTAADPPALNVETQQSDHVWLWRGRVAHGYPGWHGGGGFIVAAGARGIRGWPAGGGVGHGA